MAELKLDEIDRMDEKTKRDLAAILYALALIRNETGHGSLMIVIKENEITEMRAEHHIRPKYMKT